MWRIREDYTRPYPQGTNSPLWRGGAGLCPGPGGCAGGGRSLVWTGHEVQERKAGGAWPALRRPGGPG